MDGATTWYGNVNERGSYSVLARITALDGSGTQVEPSEGNCITQDDVYTLTCKIFDLGTDKDNTTGTEITPAPTLTPTDNIYDTLQTNGWPVGEDYAGYNFRHDVKPLYVPDADHWYLLEYKFTLTGIGTGTTDDVVIWLRVKVKSKDIQS
jgi:hypothetical protein